MDVKTQAVDRMLEAISPALTSELDRLIQENRDSLEQEFQFRLEAAIRDAETMGTSAAGLQIEQAVEQAKEETRQQVTAELDQQLTERIEAATAQARNESAEERTRFEAEMSQLQEAWSAERTKLQEELDQWKAFAEVQRQLFEASSQPEILARFLEFAEPFAQGLALYVAKPDGLALWKSRGNGAFPTIISHGTTDPDSYFRTISIRGKTVGAIYAAPMFKADALDFFVTSLERAIETFGLKLRTPLPKSAS
jgi:hypothetical protein